MLNRRNFLWAAFSPGVISLQPMLGHFDVISASLAKQVERAENIVSVPAAPVDRGPVDGAPGSRGSGDLLRRMRDGCEATRYARCGAYDY
jgi:hypothetical protein